MKDSSYSTILSISLLFLFSSFIFSCDNTKTIAHHIQELRKATNGSVTKKELRTKQNLLIESFSNIKTEDIPVDYFKESFFLISQTKVYPLLTAHYTLIQSALDNLIHITGFTGLVRLLLRNLNNNNGFSGLLYELEKGLEIYLEDEEEELVEFQRIIEIPYSNKIREFDIITTKRIIECKNINWLKKNKPKKQFLVQQKVVNLLNKKNKTNLIYQICSKQAIPHNWQQWFTINNIRFSSDKHYH